MSYFLMELKQAEVEYLNNLNRCGLCDHLGAFHSIDRRVDDDDIEHCDYCEEAGGNCPGLYFHPECFIDACPCTGYK